MSNRDFEDFQRADIEWLHHADFITTFADLTDGDATMAHEAAYTKPGFNPGFINVAAFGEDGIQITVRGEPTGGPRGDNLPGPFARIHIAKAEWDQLIALVARLAFPGPQQPGEKSGSQLQPGEVPPYDGKAFPTPIDPLCQRTDPTLPDDHPDNERYYEKRDERYLDDAGLGGAAAGDPLGQRAGDDLSGRHSGPVSTPSGSPGDGSYDPLNQRWP